MASKYIKIGKHCISFHITNNWEVDKSSIMLFSFEVDFKYKFICATLFNFEFEIDFSKIIKK